MTANSVEFHPTPGHGAAAGNAALRIKQSNASQARAQQVERAARRAREGANAPSMNQPLPMAPEKPEKPSRILVMPPSEPPVLPLIAESEPLASASEPQADQQGSLDTSSSQPEASGRRRSSLLKVPSLRRSSSFLAGGMQRSQSMATSLTKFAGGLRQMTFTRSNSKQRMQFPNFRSSTLNASVEVEKHTVSRARSVSKHRVIPLKGVPEGFESLGDYVKHHRDQKIKNAAAEGAGVLEDIPVEEADAISIEDPSMPLQMEDMSEQFDSDRQLSRGISPTLDQLEFTNSEHSCSCWSTAEAASELHAAARRNDARKIRHLLACPDPSKRVPVDILGEEGETAAVTAAKHACAASCAALLDGRADPLARDGFHRMFGDAVWPDEQNPDRIGKPPNEKFREVWGPGRTVIYHLRLHGVLDTVLSLIFPMTRVNLVRAVADQIQAWNGRSPLLVAVSKGQVELTGLLLSNAAAIPGASRIQPLCSHAGAGKIHWTPSRKERADALIEAASHRNWQCARLLVAAGVPMNDMKFTCDKMGRTALHLAAGDGQAEIVELLLNADASPNVRNVKGRQPLHEACSLGHTSVVQVLLSAGADSQAQIEGQGIHHLKNCGKDTGKTPLEMAHKHGHRHLSKYFQPEFKSAMASADDRHREEKHVAWG